MKIRTFLMVVVLFTASVFTCYSQDSVCLDSGDATTLQEYIAFLPALGLEKGIQKSLAAKMNNAAMLIGKERFNAASNILDALVLEVQGLAGGKIPSELAVQIVEAIGQLGCCDTGLAAPLGFPFLNPGDIERLAAFGIPNWSGTEPHNGIDLILKSGVTSSAIISPTAGTITSIEASSNPFSNPVGQMILHVDVSVNCAWAVSLVFEPSFDPTLLGYEALKTAQINAIKVKVGDSVEPGSPIGELLVGSLGYPHLHYMVQRDGSPVCAYQYSSTAAQAIFDPIAKTGESSGSICISPNN
jgi:hypothetical protein